VPAQNRTELIEILSAGRFDDIVGTEENEQIEFKGRAYNLQSVKEKAGLVSDVSSLADHRGGIIVLGVVTEQDETSRRDTAVLVKTVGGDEVDQDAYRKLVRQHVHPLVRDFDVRRYPETDGIRELVALHVEAQSDFDKPYIVSLVVYPDNPDRSIPHAIGWATRSGSDTHWHDAGRIQQLLAAGLRRPGPVGEEGPSPRVEDADAQLLFIAESVPGWEESPSYVIQGIPTGGDRIEDFYGQFAQEVREWHGLRVNGFGLALDWGPMVPRGRWLTRIDESGPSTLIGRSGVTTAACPVSENFLGWGRTSTADIAVINPTAIIEFTMEAIRLSYEVVQPALGAAEQWKFRCQARGWDHVRLGGLRRFPPTSLRAASTDDLDLEVTGTGDPYRDAAALLIEVFGEGFAMGESQVPYLSNGRVDLSLIPVG
jgi:hypothetical protein